LHTWIGQPKQLIFGKHYFLPVVNLFPNNKLQDVSFVFDRLSHYTWFCLLRATCSHEKATALVPPAVHCPWSCLATTRAKFAPNSIWWCLGPCVVREPGRADCRQPSCSYICCMLLLHHRNSSIWVCMQQVHAKTLKSWARTHTSPIAWLVRAQQAWRVVAAKFHTRCVLTCSCHNYEHVMPPVVSPLYAFISVGRTFCLTSLTMFLHDLSPKTSVSCVAICETKSSRLISDSRIRVDRVVLQLYELSG